MNQIKIGRFIADVRKEHGWTQSKLAEDIGVSDKTVSKWECGKGLPEISVLIPLCEVLNISVNELLSGERLSGDNYSQKAEVNIMELIKETEETKKRNKNSFMMLVVAATAIIFIVGISLMATGVRVVAFLDFPSLFVLLMATVLFMVAAGMWKDFWRGLGIVFGKNKEYSQEDILNSREAVRLTAKTILSVGIFESLLQICMLFIFLEGNINLSILIKNIAVALYTALYGLTAYLILLPVNSRFKLLS